ncbi:hypothetical protein B0H13DRAFT_2689534 [Mycena leptocephala]|nr:hypothetical protein B0H13DRAFT_2689534 [Mycena leptocephala]
MSSAQPQPLILTSRPRHLPRNNAARPMTAARSRPIATLPTHSGSSSPDCAAQSSRGPLCNKSGLFECMHSCPCPEQLPHKRGPLASSTPRLRSPPHAQVTFFSSLGFISFFGAKCAIYFLGNGGRSRPFLLPPFRPSFSFVTHASPPRFVLSVATFDLVDLPFSSLFPLPSSLPPFLLPFLFPILSSHSFPASCLAPHI